MLCLLNLFFARSAALRPSKPKPGFHPNTRKPRVLGPRASTPTRKFRACWGPRACWEQLRANLHPTEPKTGSSGTPGLRRKENFFSLRFTARLPNEAGVLAAFACHARELGFTILRLQAAFPDCEALREVGPNKGQRVLIELEYESRNFLEHQHPVNGCDLIVCWINNWPECPLEVIELSSVLRDLQNRQK